MKLFNYDGPLIHGLNRIVDYIIINIIYIVCCIPIITIGAATTALHYTSLKMVYNEGYVIRTFFKAFKENFKQATLIWIPALFVFLMLFINSRVLPLRFTGSMWSMVCIANKVVLVFFAFLFTLVYPLLAKFDNTTRGSLLNAVLISIRSLPWTLLATLIWFFPVIISYFSPFAGSYVIMFWIFFGFSVSGYLMSYIYEEKVYKHYIPTETSSKDAASTPRRT